MGLTKEEKETLSITEVFCPKRLHGKEPEKRRARVEYLKREFGIVIPSRASVRAWGKLSK